MKKQNVEKETGNSLGERTQIMETGIPGVLAKITVNRKGTRVSGYLVRAGTLAPLGNLEKERRSRKIANYAQFETKIKELITTLIKDYRANKVSSPAAPSGLICNVFNSLTPEELEFLFDGWSADVARATKTYFVRNIIPALDALDIFLIDEQDLEKIKKQLLLKAEKNLRSLKDEQTSNNLEDRLYRINTLLERLRSIRPEIPLIQFNLQKRQHVYREQIKALPDDVRRKLFGILISMAKAGELLAFSAALMLFGGLRTGEALAASVDNIIIVSGRYALYYVDKRVDTRGKVVNLLKTENAYRVIVLPYAFVLLFQTLQTALKNRKNTNANPPLSLREFSQSVKQLLLDSGLTHDSIAEITNLLTRESDAIDGVRITDPTAYILRRDWATRAANCCGLSYGDVDYYLGHANEEINRKDYLDPAAQSRVAIQLERYIIHPQYSLHPGFSPILIQDTNQIIKVDITSDCVFQAKLNTKRLVRLTITSQEPGDIIQVDLGKAPKRCKASTIPESEEMRRYRPVIRRDNRMTTNGMIQKR